ncbi:MAG: hypothetical protein AAB631_00220 [Patescibacteria group bacterium]
MAFPSKETGALLTKIIEFQETTLPQSEKLAEDLGSLLQEILKSADESNKQMENLEKVNGDLEKKVQELQNTLVDPKEIQNEAIQIILRRILDSEPDATLRPKLERLIEITLHERIYLTPDQIALKIS